MKDRFYNDWIFLGCIGSSLLGLGTGMAIVDKIKEKEKETAISANTLFERKRIEFQIECICTGMDQEAYANQTPMARLKGYDISDSAHREYEERFSKHDIMDIIDGKSPLASKYNCK
ncbi:hypothetical protein HZA98_00300 [Candidatus Woesearchaeota archaeon]|nr:hypothetical protein [Candidatus Woesearchaeota archaeon]